MDLYEAIYSRRDVRHFRSDPVPDAVLVRVLDAAHHAGSVGFMQPWNFIVVRAPERKQLIFDSFRTRETREPPRTTLAIGGRSTIR